MKKGLNKRLCFLVVMIICLSQILAPAVLAEERELAVVDWVLSNEGEKLYNSDKTYTLYSSEKDFYLDLRSIYCYEDTVDLSVISEYETTEALICAPSRDSNFVWVEGDEYSYIYATATGMVELDAFLSGKKVSYTIEDNRYYNADIAYSEISDLDSDLIYSINTVTVDVKALKEQTRYDVIARDSTYTFAYVHGAIYEVDGEYYYVNYETLENNYFDANGNFSYRGGSVELTKLDVKAASAVQASIGNLQYVDVEYIYENEKDGSSGEDAVAAFWVMFVILGYIVPIPFLVIGLCLPQSEKRGKPKYWYGLAILAAAWMLLAILITVFLCL